MKLQGGGTGALGAFLAATLILGSGSADPHTDERLQRLRNLGKAFYENPTTQMEAVEQFRQVLALNPKSDTDRLNYGLALLRAGQVKAGMAELEAVQKADPKIPHTWFNLGIEYKKQGETQKAIAQLEGMARLAPDEPITQYNLGVLYKAEGRAEEANAKFQLAARLDPNFAAPHFQLFNYYRQQGQAQEARQALARFQDLKRRHEEAGTGNEDVEWSLYSEILDPIGETAAPAAAAAAEPRFAATALPGKTSPVAALHVIDLDGSGSSDLLVVAPDGITAYRKALTPAPQPALSGLRQILSAAAGDYDNDGLADLVVLTAGGPVLFHNTKAGFERAQVKLPSGRYDAAVWLDYDHDYDLDLILLGSQTRLLRNQLPEGFEDRTADVPFVQEQAVSATVTRLLPDTKSHDLVVTYRDRPAVLYHDRLGGTFEPRTIPAVPAGAAAIISADLNNDSAPDLMWNTARGAGLALNRDGGYKAGAWDVRGAFAVLDAENRGSADVAAGGWLLRGAGLGKFGASVQPAGLPRNTTALAAADFDGDGLTDLAAVLADGTVQRVLNRTAVKNNWVRIRLNGVKNLKLGYNSEVEVKAGRLYQKQIYRGAPLTFGLGAAAEIDTIRITWPNGLIQNETKPKVNTVLSYQEAQRLSGSCPVIWTWNGSGFEYVTDVLGVAPLGASAGDGKYFPVDHDEYVFIRGDQLREKDGRLEVRLTEELAEVTYLDQVRLVAVDHPAGVEVYSNDKWKSPPYPEFRLFGVTHRTYPRRATENGTRDVTARILKTDGSYPDGFRRTFQNVAAAHTLELDFTGAAATNRAALILRGWVDWADGSTFLAQAQATPGGLQPPQLQVKDAVGRWVTVLEDMGMPAGKPKTIAVDLSGRFLSASREIRIVTNLCIYWDEIFLSEETAAPPARLTELNASKAELAFRGFSKNVVHPLRLQPEQFFYEPVSTTAPWNPTPGLYTRYGPVEELVSEVDDRLAILGSGDELRLSFDARQLPAVQKGWTRDWLLKVDGWAKDRDANTAYSQSVEPLPFHGMSGYPYGAGEQFPQTAAHQEWRRKYQTRPALRLLRALNESGTDSRGAR